MRAAIVLLNVAGVLCSVGNWAQGQSGPRVDLSGEVALVGETPKISLSLEAAGEEISAVESVISIPSVLVFVRVELSEVAESASARIETQFQAGTEDEQNQLVVKVKSGGPQPLPDGLIAFLVLQVPESLVHGEDFKELTLQNKSTVTGQDEQPTEVQGRTGSLTVMAQAPPIIACFFYLH